MGSRWPDGSPAAVTFGWDDGTTADRRLVELLNSFGIRATFFLNSGKFGLTAQQSGWKDYVAASEVADLYAGHEVGSHTVDHPDLTALSDAAIADQVRRDRSALEELVGYQIRGFASPFRAQDARVERVLRSVGMRYSRGPGTDRSGRPPADPLQWMPAAHCLDDIAGLLADPAPGSVFCIWGHAYEYDEQDAWPRLEAMLGLVAQAPCWVAPHGEVIATLLDD